MQVFYTELTSLLQEFTGQKKRCTVKKFYTGKRSYIKHHKNRCLELQR